MRLAARDAEITILFCDINGFSRISAACGAAVAIEWVCDVLSELSDCVAEFQGVLVDYAGDALEALWGAPLPTHDHASMAYIGLLVTFAGFLISLMSLGMSSSVGGRMVFVLAGLAVSLFGIIGLINPAYLKTVWMRVS